jgi:hypothetical protein
VSILIYEFVRRGSGRKSLLGEALEGKVCSERLWKMEQHKAHEKTVIELGMGYRSTSLLFPHFVKSINSVKSKLFRHVYRIILS